jgi:3-demethoxyubiquinol 3-hydroxylase
MEVIARLAADESLGDRVMKVDHAGEHGAVNIYRAQLLACRWRKSDITSELKEVLDHEIFAAELTRRVRPRCRSYHLCGLGGFALGLVTGLCGRASIAATTVAVETVVLRHLEAQISTLHSVDSAAVSAIRSIIDDERAHRDRAGFRVHGGPLLAQNPSTAGELGD